MKRQIFLDTETTGLHPLGGDRIVEIGAVEVIDEKPTGNNFHYHINPERSIPAEVVKIHGIDDDSVKDAPIFPAIAESFIEFIKGAEVIIHNAPFDVGFINAELSFIRDYNFEKLADYCTIIDSLAIARNKYPSKKNSLDALMARYGVDASSRTHHGALLDSLLLAEVYKHLIAEQLGIVFEKKTMPNADNNLNPEQEAAKKKLTNLKNTFLQKAKIEDNNLHASILEKLKLAE